MFFGITSLRSSGRQLHAAPAVAQRDRDGALGRVLADDVAVEFLHDFARGHGGGLLSGLGMGRSSVVCASGEAARGR